MSREEVKRGGVDLVIRIFVLLPPIENAVAILACPTVANSNATTNLFFNDVYFIIFPISLATSDKDDT